jgi:HK97 family phage major capsid protein
MNSLKDVGARAKALRSELDAMKQRALDEGRDLTDAETERIDRIKSETVMLSMKAGEIRERQKRRRDLDAIAQGVDVSDDYRTKAGKAPQLAFSDEQLKSLHNAITERRPLAVQSKTVSTTEGPQAAAVQYRFSDFPYLRDKMRVLDVIPQEPTTATQVTYFRALAAASAAGAVAEGASKPESTPSWESASTNVRKVAHWARANDEVLQDFSSALDFIGREMLAGLVDQESTQLLSGDGVAPNLLGLLNQSGIQTQARGTDTNADALFKAIQLVRTSVFLEPDTLIMRPDNFGAVRLLKDSTGQYLAGGLQDSDPARLWGFRVLLTTRLPANVAVVSNMSLGARVYMRQAPTLEVNPYGGNTDAWLKNQTLVRAEERLALTCPRPSAIVKVTGLTT